MNTVRLWWMIRRRSADTKDPQGMTTALAIIAFAVTTAILLIVVGGFMAFLGRAKLWLPPDQRAIAAQPYADQYPALAGVASLLLLVPLIALGGAAARLAVARRDARLASLRLAGATTGQVTGLALLDAVFQALVGALIGVVGYVGLIPLVAQLRFQGRPFSYDELWVGIPVLVAAVAAIAVIAAVSSLVSLRRVAITPLGVAARQTPPGMRFLRVVLFFAVVAVMCVAARMSFGSQSTMLIVLGIVLALGFAALNLVGPFMVWIVGKATVGISRRFPTLLAGRRIVDSPRTAWRSVGGVALATFIAGMASIFAMIDPGASASAADRQYRTDLQTGGFLTLAIAGVLAAVSTGVMQAGRVIDQRAEYRTLTLAGTDVRTLDRARFRETMIPLTVSVGVSTAAALLFLVPLGFASGLTNMAVIGQFLGCVALAYGLVLLGAGTSRTVARAVLAPSGSA